MPADVLESDAEMPDLVEGLSDEIGAERGEEGREEGLAEHYISFRREGGPAAHHAVKETAQSPGGSLQRGVVTLNHRFRRQKQLRSLN